MGFLNRLFGNKKSDSDPIEEDSDENDLYAPSDESMGWTPIEDMTDEEVLKELFDRVSKLEKLEYIKELLETGAGERQLLRLYRSMERDGESEDV